MFKIGEKVFFLVEQKDGSVTVEDGELISYDKEIICMVTYVGGDRNKIRFIEKEYVFDNDKDCLDALDKLHEEILKVKRMVRRTHISLFETKI